MIKNILIPENIGSYYFFSKTIVGIDIGRTEIHATVVKATGNKKIIQNLIEEKIESNNNIPIDQRIIQALKNIFLKIGKYDSVYASISSSLIIFKDLSVPFLGEKKIKMVVPFEVESLLPFSLENAVIDSIITKEDLDQKKTEVLVAAIKKEQIDEYINLFNAAGISVEKISIDMLELYGLFKSIPNYNNVSGVVALIDIGLYSTRLALEIDNQLKYIRVLPRGIINIAKKISTNGSDTPEILEQIFRFGFNDKLSQDAIKDLFSELKFTIESFTSKLKNKAELKKVVLTGSAVDIPSINDIITDSLEVNSESLQVKKIIHNGKVFSDLVNIPNGFLVSIATALSSDLTQDFNLQRDYAQAQEDALINKQLIALLSLFLGTILLFSIFSFFYIKNIRNIKNSAESEAVSELKKVFKLKEKDFKSGDKDDLKKANKAADAALKKEEEAWKQLSNENRYSYLKALLELSSCIKPKDIQLNLISINIEKDTIKLYGEVPGYDELKKLENQLKCPAFKPIRKLTEFNFKQEPIILYIKSDREA